MERASGRDRGQAALLVIVVVTALVASMAVAGVSLGGRILDRARAQTAADAAALAGLADGRTGAVELAGRHGATVVSFVRDADADRVVVVVRRGSVTAAAAATDAP